MNDPQSEPNEAPEPKPLSAHDAAEFVGRVAELSNAGLPLVAGLRAAAAELPNSRLAAALERVAAALERGESLEQAMAAQRGALPRHLQALVTAGVRTGKLGQVLEEFVEFRQASSDFRRSVWLALAYPALQLLLLVALVLFFVAYVIPGFAAMFRDFKMPLSRLTVAIFQLAKPRFIVPLCALVIVTIVAAFVLGVLIGPRRRRWVLNRIPLFGPLWRFSGLAEMTCLVQILLASEVPLPEALRLTADGISDADLAAGCRQLAARVESGTRLADAIEGLPQFNPTMRQIIAWGESQSALPVAIDTMAEITTRRLQIRADLVRAIVPPAVFMGVVAVLGLIMIGLYMPLIGLLNSLSGGPISALWADGGSISGSGNPVVFSPSRLPMLSPLAVSVLISCSVVLISLLIVKLIRKAPPGTLKLLLRLTAGLLVAAGALGVMFLFLGVIGLLLVLVLIVGWGIALTRFRRSQQLTLLNLLALSADRGMPLAPAIRALAEEEGGVFYQRAMALADCLAAGMPTPEAIERNRSALPPNSALAARVGEGFGALGPALRIADDRRNRLGGNALVGPARWASPVYLLAAASVIVPYMAKRIVPAWHKIYFDFHHKLPPLSAIVFDALSSRVTMVLCALSLGLIAIGTIYAIFRQLGWVRFDLPLVGRIFAPFDSAVVLRWLALIAEHGGPLDPVLGLLAVRYPRQLIRKRLKSAGGDIFCGRDWADSLRAAKLVQRADAAILRAAARVGNLPWALTEAASNGERRLNYRLNAFGQILFPLVILALGAAVMVFVVGGFLPLIELINGLGKPR